MYNIGDVILYRATDGIARWARVVSRTEAGFYGEDLNDEFQVIGEAYGYDKDIVQWT
jgi:hypothetical protein